MTCLVKLTKLTDFKENYGLKPSDGMSHMLYISQLNKVFHLQTLITYEHHLTFDNFQQMQQSCRLLTVRNRTTIVHS